MLSSVDSGIFFFPKSWKWQVKMLLWMSLFKLSFRIIYLMLTWDLSLNIYIPICNWISLWDVEMLVTPIPAVVSVHPATCPVLLATGSPPCSTLLCTRTKPGDRPGLGTCAVWSFSAPNWRSSPKVRHFRALQISVLKLPSKLRPALPGSCFLGYGREQGRHYWSGSLHWDFWRL